MGNSDRKSWSNTVRHDVLVGILSDTHDQIAGRVRELVEKKPDYLFLGHSHRRRDEPPKGTRIINPGALHRVSPRTVALLDLERDALRSIELS